MLFSSIPFLYYFLPCVLVIYFLSPKILKNTALLLASLFFYGWGEPGFLGIMILSIVLGYVFGILIEKFRESHLSRVFLVLSAASSLGMLGIFKYADFFLENFNKFTGVSLKLLGIVLPIGISFYTFQILSYTIDVYRGQVEAQKNPIHLAAYISMFPQLIAGPIVRYADVEEQLTKRQHSFEKVALGMRQFIIGLGKKILIANALGELVMIFKGSDDLSVAFYWLYAVAYTLHVYFDFSGYSDMAIGLAKIFGFELMENFNYPYIAKSITEFWRRWHISLGKWFRDYVYIPLGGNRVPKWKWFRNIAIVWMLTGFWHGAAWNFVIWGAYFAVLLIMEKVYLHKYLEKAKVWNHIYVLLFVMVSFLIFDSVDIREGFSNICGLFGANGEPLYSQEFGYYFRSYFFLIMIAIIGATPLPKAIVKKLQSRKRAEKVINLLEPLALIILMIMMTAYLVDGSFNPFLYFRF